MKKSRAGKLLVFLLLVTLPASFLFFLSKGNHGFGKLPVKGTIESFDFKSSDGKNVSETNFEGKIIIANVLSNSCPEHCGIAVTQFKKFVFDEICNDKYTDVAILSHVVDYYGQSNVDVNELMRKLDISNNQTQWLFVTGEHNALYDVNINGKNLYEQEKENVLGGKPYYEVALLIDMEGDIRGLYQLNKTSQMQVLLEDVKILKREYNRRAHEE